MKKSCIVVMIVLFTAAVAAARPQTEASPVSIQEAPSAEVPARRGGMRFEFHLSGGLSMIDGGDYNAQARGYNEYYADMNNYYASRQGYTYTWTSDLPEAKSMMNLRGEFVLRFNRWVGIGFGFEYLTKSLTGLMERNYSADGYRYDYSTYYILETSTTKYTFDYDDTIRAIPLTFNVYGFFPIGKSMEVFAFSGIGYYLGALELNMTEVGLYDDVDSYFYRSSGAQYNTRKNQGEYNYTEKVELTSKALGFHAGAGFGFFFGRNIEFFGEALYRVANFKEWTGDFSWNEKDEYYFGYQSSGYNNYTETDEDSYSGTLYHYTYHSPAMNKDYRMKLGVFEEDPTDTSTYFDYKKAAISLSGLVLRVGLRIGFGQR